MVDVPVANSVAKVHNWLMGWMDEDGGLHSPVIHKFGSVVQGYPKIVSMIRMDNIEDSTWHQSMAVLAYATLYKKTGDKKFLKIAERMADRLVSLQIEDGSYKNSNFEHDSDPFRNNKCVIHQAFPDIALLEMFEILKRQKYLRSAKGNLDNFLLETLFDRKNKIFFNFERSRSHTANMTSVAIEALVKLAKITGDDSYLSHAKNNGDWICRIFNGQYVPYADHRENIEPLPFYNGITLQGLDDLFYATKDVKYLNLMKAIVKYLRESTDTETGFFYHRKVGKSVVKRPQYVAASGIILWNVLNSMKCGVKFPINDYIKNLNGRIYSSGGIGSYIGYGNWEDIFPCPAWVAMAFAGLCEYVDEKSLQKVDFDSVEFNNFRIEKAGYNLIDEKNFLTLEKNGKVIWKANKKEEVPDVNKIKAFYEKDVLLAKITNAMIKTVVGNKIIYPIAKKTQKIIGC